MTMSPLSDTTAAPPSPAGISLHGVTKRYGRNQVLLDVTAELPAGRVYGLLGANGAGKTTLMSLICNHAFPTSGIIRIDGQDPAENAEILARTCYVREDQRYNDAFSVANILAVLPGFYAEWDADVADTLVDRFRLPRKTTSKKLSRGQRSALAIVIALASRAPYTFLDEPYLGLDPTARSIFYEELMRAVAAHPRTIVMSTHLIDEAADLMEDVLVLHEGRIALHADIDDARRTAFVLRGLEADVRALIGDRVVLTERRLGGILSATVRGTVDDDVEDRAAMSRVSLEPATLQELVAAIGVNSLAGPADVKEVHR